MSQPGGGTPRRETRQALQRLFWFLGPYVVTVSAAFILFYSLTPNFLTAILGHHLKQGSELNRLEVLLKGFDLYATCFRGHPLLLLLTIPALVSSLKAKDRLQALFACQIPTALAFLFLSRGLDERHLVHLVPSIATLFAASLLSGSPGVRLSRSSRPLALLFALLLTGLAMWPSLQRNGVVASWSDATTLALAEYIQAHTNEDDYMLSDYPGLNFYARRRATSAGAGVSRGATLGGQILGSDLIQEIEEKKVRMVLINIAQGAHQLSNLRDYDQFHRYVQDHFSLAGRAIYDYRLLEVYHADDLMPMPLEVNFGDEIMLTNHAWGNGPIDLIDPSKSQGLEAIEAGDELLMTLRWRSLADMNRDYYLVLRLIDDEANLCGLGQKQLMDIGTETYWDEEGLERAVQFPTSLWPVGETVLDDYKLPIFPGTPPGRYDVIGRLRPSDTWEGLKVRSPGAIPPGFDYRLGTVEVRRPSSPPADDELDIGRLVMEDFGDDLQLIGHEPIAEQARPGDTLHLVLFWRALRSMDTDWELLIQAQDSQGRLLAEDRFHLANAYHPTVRWAADEVVRGQYDLVLDPTAPSGEAKILLNLADTVAGQALMEKPFVLSHLNIEGWAREFDIPQTIQQRVMANLGNHVVLLGYDLAEATVKPGDILHITLYWQAMSTMDTSYTVFTHLLGEDGQVWGQKDNVPVQGMYPTTAWLPDEVIVDDYEFTVRPEAPLGKYVLEIGMYDASTEERLPLLDESGQECDNRVLLSGINVSD